MVQRPGASEARAMTRQLQVLRLRPVMLPPCGRCPSCRHIEERKARLRDINEREARQPPPPQGHTRNNRVMFDSNPVVHQISAREQPQHRPQHSRSASRREDRSEDQWRGARPREPMRTTGRTRTDGGRTTPRDQPASVLFFVPRRCVDQSRYLTFEIITFFPFSNFVCVVGMKLPSRLTSGEAFRFVESIELHDVN